MAAGHVVVVGGVNVDLSVTVSRLPGPGETSRRGVRPALPIRAEVDAMLALAATYEEA